MYKTGVETKQNILCCAKKLFYKKGFKDSSVSDICKAADIQPGTFTYHFPKKNDLLNVIYSEYMQTCIDFVDSKGLDLSPAKHHLYVLAVYYTHLYTDERNTAFHKEVMEIGSMNVWFNNPRKLIAGFSGEGNLPENNELFELCVKADNAARREFNLDFIASGDRSPGAIKKLLGDIYSVNARLFDVDSDTVREDLDSAFGFAEKYLNVKISIL